MATILIGMADLNIARCPDVLTTLGLGSCVGITLFDRTARIGGLAHIMLPSSDGYTVQNRAKFADLAIADLLNRMLRAGAARAALTAKLAGGAHMFGNPTNDVLAVGARNVAACTKILKSLGIAIQASDTGGAYGRTIELNTENGSLRIKTVGAGEKSI